MANDKKDDNDEVNEPAEESRSRLTETLKKVLATGVSAAFMTEESIRTYLQDLKLPKDVLALIIQGANKSKDEITGRVVKEMSGILGRIDFVKEVSRFVEEHKFRVQMDIEVLKKDKNPSTGKSQ